MTKAHATDRKRPTSKVRKENLSQSHVVRKEKAIVLLSRRASIRREPKAPGQLRDALRSRLSVEQKRLCGRRRGNSANSKQHPVATHESRLRNAC